LPITTPKLSEPFEGNAAGESGESDKSRSEIDRLAEGIDNIRWFWHQLARDYRGDSA